ncbi:GH92 family glycosyl hydrolase [Akkermansia sp. N21116]|uniref:GH92 family glycosyl hydrolase n=1 Tax=Akkermansia sp. N21116 TaxID=3040764 RepID=UPI00244ED3FB|nr:GH92 family glycosyl hydrolase [Akkermansia sp. N21116]WPX40411.1 GH92 family glycosyl hydrolase [Akkermansia sp. N21116]
MNSPFQKRIATDTLIVFPLQHNFITLKYLLLFPLVIGNLPSGYAKPSVDYVNPFIGASTSVTQARSSHGLGKTFPGATTPFGLTQISPNTVTGGDNGSGYSYENNTIEGFAFTQMSGVGWYGDLGNFLVMPTTGRLHTVAGTPQSPNEGYRSRFSKKDEVAQAGYYAASLTDYGIRAEATAAPHSGILRFTFPKNSSSRIQIDLARRVGGTSTEQYIQVINDHTIKGWMKCTPEGGGWGNGAGHPNYTVYFYAQFSKPFQSFGVWQAEISEDMERRRHNVETKAYQKLVSQAEIEKGCREKQGKHLGFYSEFQTAEGEQILIKAGISFTSMQAAEENLQSEIKNFDFDHIRNNARNLWNDVLDKIIVQGGTEDDKTVFYTALYHTMIDPRNFSDVNGSYLGGDSRVRKNNRFVKRTIFSGWDVFRSQYPLQTIINPEIVNDSINSLVELADESDKGYLERWEFLNAYSGCMIGNPAVSVIADAYAKGIRNFDIIKGYKFARQSCEKFGNGEKGFTPGSISKTLEYAYSDWCLSRLARALGNGNDETIFSKRSQSYRNIFDSEKKWFRPRNADGSWKDWPVQGRLAQGYGCTESNPYQQGWFVPHDIEGFIELLGGKDMALMELRNLFNHTPEDMLWNNYYNHANEPVHHIPFLFNRLGSPCETQFWTRKICNKAYGNSVEGLVGNEDVGQMSAWYVLAAMGIHPICPGDTRYEITSPVFEQITIKLDPRYAKGKEFVIKANHNNRKNIYIQSARLNGKPWTSCGISHEQIIEGGVLELDMGQNPNNDWGTFHKNASRNTAP